MAKINYLEIVIGGLSVIGKYRRLLFYTTFLVYMVYIFLFSVQTFSGINYNPGTIDFNKKYPIVAVRKDLLIKVDNLFSLRREEQSNYSEMHLDRDPFVPFVVVPSEIVLPENSPVSEPIANP